MTEDDTEWEEWTMDITFNWTYTTEGPFPVDMDDEARSEMVKEQFWDAAWDHFYHAYTGATLETQLETSEPEKYGLEEVNE